MIVTKDQREIELMREAGRIVALVHSQLKEFIKPGITTAQINKFCEKVIRDAGATPSFLNLYGFPGAVCTSINEVVVHGIPSQRKLKDGDIMLLNEIEYRLGEIERFDIVVIRRGDEYLIKRVIGLPGEKVKYLDNKLYINGKYVKEEFKHKKTNDFPIYQLGKDEYFVMGDNRTNSKDSRMIGSVFKDEILGKASLTIFPFSRFGIKE